MESRDKALENAEFVAKDMESRKLREAAKCLREGIGETTTYLLDDYPREHRRRIRTNNMIERLNREDQTAHARGRQLPRRTQRVDARLRALCHVERVVDSPLPRHVKAR